jgi:hypothetical protein
LIVRCFSAISGKAVSRCSAPLDDGGRTVVGLSSVELPRATNGCPWELLLALSLLYIAFSRCSADSLLIDGMGGRVQKTGLALLSKELPWQRSLTRASLLVSPRVIRVVHKGMQLRVFMKSVVLLKCSSTL